MRKSSFFLRLKSHFQNVSVQSSSRRSGDRPKWGVLKPALKKNVRASMLTTACMFMIALLTGACAGEYKKQTSSFANEADQVSAKGEPETTEAHDDQNIVCRHRVISGTRLKEKVCATKAQWDLLNEKNRKKTEGAARGFRQSGEDRMEVDPLAGGDVSVGKMKR